MDGVSIYVGDAQGANLQKNKLCGEDIVTKEEEDFVAEYQQINTDLQNFVNKKKTTSDWP